MADFDLSSYPPPEAVEQISTDQIIEAHVARFVAEWEAFRAERPDLSLPEYNAQALESDVPRVLFGATSYRELLLRVRINEAVRANLLAYATGSDLDHLAAFYDVARLGGEEDARLRVRVILALRGRSTGGTAARYESIAMSASIRVRSVKVYRVGRDPTVRVAVYAADNGGIADEALLSIVAGALNDPAVKMVNDTISVQSAVFQVVDIEANVWLLPTAAETLIPALAVSIRAAWATESSLGFDLTKSWITAKLMQSGVYRVDIVAPAASVVADPFRAISIGAVTLHNAGRDF